MSLNSRSLLPVLVLLICTSQVPAQTITSFNPAFGSAFDYYYIDVYGSGFAPGTLVLKFGNTVDPTAGATSVNHIQARVPTNAPLGPCLISVSINGGAPIYSPQYFMIIGRGPYVTNFSPYGGSANTTVTVGGAHFAGVTNVSFNGKSGTGLAVALEYSLTVNAPSGVTTGPITVIATNGSYTTPSNFYAPPVITEFSPATGRSGTNVLLLGTNFLGATAIFFGTNSATNFSVLSNNAVRVAVPNGAQTGKLTLIAPAGPFLTTSNFVIQPTIFGFSPGFGPVETSVTVTGANFNVGTPSVKFGEVPAATPTGITFSKLTAVVPSGATSGPVTLTTTDGSSTSSSLFYLPARITSFSPINSAPGTRVKITGINFTDASAVSFNGTAAAFVVTNNTIIGATVPTGFSTGPLSVTTPAGSTNSSSFFYAAPVIASFSPTHGLPGTNVVITGSNFLGATAVKFNGTNASFTVPTNNTRLVAVVPSGATTGPIIVIGPAGSSSSSSLFYLPARITSFTPTNSAPGTRVKITGINFTNASAVSFNGTAAVFVVTNNTTIGAIVPANFSTGPISVTTPAGSTNSSSFFYAAPVIASFTPTHGLPGTNVVITGSNLLGATAVKFNGTNASFTAPINNTTLVAVVPNNAKTGPISVVAPAGTCTSVTNFVLDYNSDMAISVIGAPNPVFIGSNLTYTISVTTSGPFVAGNVRLTNTLPSSVTLKSAVTTRGTLSTNNNPITGILGNITNGSPVVVTLTVVPNTPGTVVDNVSVASDNPDPALANNTFSVTNTVLPLPLLTIRRAAPGRLNISWPVALTNYGLQYKTVLTLGTSWSNVMTAPVISGDQKIVTETNTSSGKFYRLKK